MNATIYTESVDLLNLASRLKESYYLHLGHVDIESIYFAEKVGESSKSGKALEILGVTHGGVRQMLQMMGRQQTYCLSVNKDVWDEIHPHTQEWLMFEALYSIEPYNTGKLKKPDIVEHSPIIEFFANTSVGIRWKKCDGELPSLLGSETLAIPLPPDEDDEGSSY